MYKVVTKYKMVINDFEEEVEEMTYIHLPDGYTREQYEKVLKDSFIAETIGRNINIYDVQIKIISVIKVLAVTYGLQHALTGLIIGTCKMFDTTLPETLSEYDDIVNRLAKSADNEMPIKVEPYNINIINMYELKENS